MREIEVGIRIDIHQGVSFFGTEEVNDLLRRGASVVAIEPGGAIMRKLGEAGESVRLTLSGFSLKVKLQEASEAGVPDLPGEGEDGRPH